MKKLLKGFFKKENGVTLTVGQIVAMQVGVITLWTLSNRVCNMWSEEIMKNLVIEDELEKVKIIESRWNTIKSINERINEMDNKNED